MPKILVDANGSELVIGNTYKSFRGEDMVLDSIEKPKHEGSTGRVYVKQEGLDGYTGYYPSVIGAKWVEVCERCDIVIRPEGGHMCGSCGKNI